LNNNITKEKQELKRLKEIVFPKSIRSHDQPNNRVLSPIENLNDESLIIPKRNNISMDNFTSDHFTEKRM